MRRLLLLLVVPALGFRISAQQDAQYTMYGFNKLAINPAYAGAQEATNLTLLGRAQWVGIAGAPNTSTLTGSTYIESIRSGIGISIIGDRLGSMSTIGGGADYAFHLGLGQAQRAKLQIGLHGGFYQKGLYLPKGGWKYDESSGLDPAVNTAVGNTFVGDLGAGLYFRLMRKDLTTKAFPTEAFFIGASVSHILEPSLEGLFEVQNIGPDSRLRRDITAAAGVTIPLTRTIMLQPTTWFRTDLATFQTDLSCNLYISPMVFGLNYRGSFIKNHESIGGIVGFHANTNLFIGYAYDFLISSLSGFSSGSHELILSYTFPKVAGLPHPENDVRGNHSP